MRNHLSASRFPPIDLHHGERRDGWHTGASLKKEGQKRELNTSNQSPPVRDRRGGTGETKRALRQEIVVLFICFPFLSWVSAILVCLFVCLLIDCVCVRVIVHASTSVCVCVETQTQQEMRTERQTVRFADLAGVTVRGLKHHKAFAFPFLST